MARVLLLDPDPVHAAELKTALRALTGDTTVCGRLEEVSRLLRERTEVLIAVSEGGELWKAEAKRLRQLTDKVAGTIQIICLLRGPYRGPGDRLHGARHGIRVIHEER
jgi:hypothetical protein